MTLPLLLKPDTDGTAVHMVAEQAAKATLVWSTRRFNA